MNKLTEATCYEDIEQYIKTKGWDSKTIASKVTWYGKSCGKYRIPVQTKKESTRALHEQVYYWLCTYQSNFNNGNFFKQKKSAITQLEKGKSVKEVFEYFQKKGVQVSKVTLHKYQNSLLEVEGCCSCEGLGSKWISSYCKYCEARLSLSEQLNIPDTSNIESVYETFKNLNQYISKLRLREILDDIWEQSGA